MLEQLRGGRRLSERQQALAHQPQWLRGLGWVPADAALALDARRFLGPPTASGFGVLQGVRPAVQLARTPVAHPLPAMPPGSHPPVWV